MNGNFGVELLGSELQMRLHEVFRQKNIPFCLPFDSILVTYDSTGCRIFKRGIQN